MNLEEFSSHDATSLADLVRRREVRVDELAACTMAAVEAVNGTLNAVVEAFSQRADELARRSRAAAPRGP